VSDKSIQKPGAEHGGSFLQTNMSLMKSNNKGMEQNGNQRKLRVLLVEDSAPDATIIVRAIERGGFRVASRRVQTSEEMATALDNGEWDLILADHAMPGFSAPEALQLLKERRLDTPFIIVSGYINEDTAVEAMRAGAHDYIMKDRLARLLPAIERELREAETRALNRQSQEQLRRAHEELEARVESRTAALKAANLKLQAMFEERQRLENELLEIAEKERRRIGFDLHDDLGQKLTGAGFMAKGLQRRLAEESHPCAEEAGKVHALIEEITQHTHNLARQFSALDAQGTDLATVLKGLAGHVNKMFEITCGLNICGELPAMPRHTITQLYKICQEAISNSIKHGKAKTVVVSVACAGDELSLCIRNDGLPFAPGEASRNRMGLRIMNYRANTIGATFEIKPQPKGGTCVTCVLPLPNNGTPKAARKPHEPTHKLKREARGAPLAAGCH
jgi:signal transduction histidine kinase